MLRELAEMARCPWMPSLPGGCAWHMPTLGSPRWRQIKLGQRVSHPQANEALKVIAGP